MARSLKEETAGIEAAVQQLQRSLREHKTQVESARAGIVSMENQLSLNTEDTPKSLLPQIEELLEDLMTGAQQTRSLNEHIQKQLIAVKKEKSTLSQHLISSNTRCEILSDQIGLP